MADEITYDDYYKMLNYSTEFNVELEVEVNQATKQGVAMLCISAWILLSNIFFSVSLLLQRYRQMSTITMLMINAAAADMMQGLVIFPFHGYQEVHKWTFGKHFCKAFSALEPTLLLVSTLSLLAVNVDRLLYVVNPERYHQRVQIRLRLRLALLCLPWLLAATVFPPIWLKGEDTSYRYYLNQKFCILVLRKNTAIALSCLIFVPGVATVVTAVVIVAIVVRSSGLPAYRLVRDGTGDTMLSPLCSLFAVNALNLILRFPLIFSTTFILFFCNETQACKFESVHLAFIVIYWMNFSGYGLNPLAWMIDHHVRRAYLKVLLCKHRCSRQRTNNEEFHLSDVSYQVDHTITPDSIPTVTQRL